MTILHEVLGRAIGQRVRELRIGVGMTQGELARRTSSHREIISRIESGRHLATLDVLAVIAEAFGLTLELLLLDGIEWAPIDQAARASLRKVAA